MLFYHFEQLDNFIKSDLISNLKIEKETIQEISHLYNNKKMNLLSITTNMLSMSDGLDKNSLDNFYETVSLLKKSFEAINGIQKLVSQLSSDLISMISLYDKGLENNLDQIKANLVEYNKQRDDLSHKILEFETTNTVILNSAIKLSLKVSPKKIKKQQTTTITNSKLEKDTLKIDIELEPYDNNILIVSEKEQKAYLPFFYSKIKEIYETTDNQYPTLQDVVEDLYIVPLDRFKNSTFARFKEAFDLIRQKEKGSISEALDLGLELMFKTELNPIIIAACRSLEELDIYLSYLEDNECYEFPCFEINFKIMPQISTKS